MFLHRVSRQLLIANNVFSVKNLRCLNIALGRSETELIDKWKQKFQSENVSEIENSIRYILEHIVERNEVMSFHYYANKYDDDLESLADLDRTEE